jgi:hypothetical protein
VRDFRFFVRIGDEFLNFLKLSAHIGKIFIVREAQKVHRSIWIQTAGIAGKHTTRGRVDKITGLDPNRVGFNINQSIGRLAAGDARFVEVRSSKVTNFLVVHLEIQFQVYHSNGGKIGNMQHVVDSDKYISRLIQTSEPSNWFSLSTRWWQNPTWMWHWRMQPLLCRQSFHCSGQRQKVPQLHLQYSGRTWRKVRKVYDFWIANICIQFFRGCGYLPSEWWGEETGLKQIIAEENDL